MIILYASRVPQDVEGVKRRYYPAGIHNLWAFSSDSATLYSIPQSTLKLHTSINFRFDCFHLFNIVTVCMTAVLFLNNSISNTIMVEVVILLLVYFLYAITSVLYNMPIIKYLALSTSFRRELSFPIR